VHDQFHQVAGEIVDRIKQKDYGPRARRLLPPGPLVRPVMDWRRF
jgi:hypothetical protein